MTLDAGAQHVLNLIKEAKRPAFTTLTPAEAREVSATSRRVMQPDPPEVALVEDLKCPGPDGKIRLRRYRGIGTDPEAGGKFSNPVFEIQKKVLRSWYRPIPRGPGTDPRSLSRQP